MATYRRHALFLTRPPLLPRVRWGLLAMPGLLIGALMLVAR
ncbi:MAG: hypothetical protein ACI8QZ_003710 [Chlamydiales bacterium]|jgi:hypothetical protein